MDEGKDRRRERHVIRRYPLASMSVTQFGESQESTTDVSSVTSTRGVVRYERRRRFEVASSRTKNE